MTKNILKKIVFKILPFNLISKIRKIHYYHKLRALKETEEEDLQFLKYFISPGETAIDIGANYGSYTKIMSQLAGANGKVYSIEPIKPIFEILQTNVKKLGLNNVETLNMAISESFGDVFMEVPDFENGGENYYEAQIVSDVSNKKNVFKIQSFPLDLLYKKYRFEPTFIKCDVEGHEWFVFKSAKLLLQKTKPVLLIEINDSLKGDNEKTQQLLSLLTAYDYGIYVVSDGKLTAWNDEKKINYYFLTTEHFQKYQQNQSEKIHKQDIP